MRRAGLFLGVAAWAVTAGCGADGAARLVLATSTSVQSSGLLDVILPAVHQSHGIEVRVHLTGSGRALAMLERGDADVVISHAPEAEARALRAHPTWFYRKLMFNTFVIVGPDDDPAGVRGVTEAAAAMRRIAASGSRFVSRGDASGTHEREQLLWKMAGTEPQGGRRLVSGAGMATTLRQAGAQQAYTLADRPTVLRLRQAVDLAILLERDAVLVNTHAILIGDADPGKRRLAHRFAAWLSDGGGRQLIAGYRIGLHQAFIPWPEGARADDPHAVPR